jgi:uncharacterized protein YcbK (DUF882 family)
MREICTASARSRNGGRTNEADSAREGRGLRSILRSMAIGLLVIAFAGNIAAAADSTRDRTISFYTVNAKETLTVQYMKDGKRIPEAMDKINWILRDWRRDEKANMDPDLIDLVWEIHHELGSKEPIHVISAYRSRATNDMLRRTVGGQASESRHILGKAMDVMFPDVPLKRLRYAGLVHERGGVGYYPTSQIPFVHIDTDRVRAWPRATRQELALLFPSGRTQHLAADGGAITPADVRVAMNNRDLADEMSEFHKLRTTAKPAVQYASLMPSLPQLPKLLSSPKPVERPMALGTRPSDDERARLAALAAEPPPAAAAPLPAQRSLVQEASARMPMPPAPRPAPEIRPPAPKSGVVLPPAPVFVAQPSFDDEHFEELSFNVFPAAPLLTPTSSQDDAVLVRLIHPFAQELKGEAMSIASFIDGETEAAQNLSALPNRKVASRAR